MPNRFFAALGMIASLAAYSVQAKPTERYREEVPHPDSVGRRPITAEGVDIQEAQGILSSYGLDVVDAIPEMGLVLAQARPGKSRPAAAGLRIHPKVVDVQKDLWLRSTVPLSHEGSGVKAYSGTSMACPHVAGLAALAVSKGAQGAEAVRAALAAAAAPVSGLSAQEQGAGVVDASKL